MTEEMELKLRLEFLEEERKRLLEEKFESEKLDNLRESMKAVMGGSGVTPSAPPLTLNIVPSAPPLTLNPSSSAVTPSAPPLTITADTALILDEMVLGTGASSVVRRGLLNNALVAVKIFNQATNKARDALKVESELLLQLRHERVVELYGCCTEGETLLLAMEYLSGGSLWELLHGDSPAELRHRKKSRIALDVAEGMAFLHSHSVLHRDLKSPNVLLDAQLRGKLCDFGISKTIR
jgi:predicted Ser/Thr protein kinase